MRRVGVNYKMGFSVEIWGCRLCIQAMSHPDMTVIDVLTGRCRAAPLGRERIGTNGAAVERVIRGSTDNTLGVLQALDIASSAGMILSALDYLGSAYGQKRAKQPRAVSGNGGDSRLT